MERELKEPGADHTSRKKFSHATTCTGTKRQVLYLDVSLARRAAPDPKQR